MVMNIFFKANSSTSIIIAFPNSITTFQTYLGWGSRKIWIVNQVSIVISSVLLKQLLIYKQYGRVMGCWKSPAATLCEHLALRQTVTSIRKISTDQWVNRSTLSVYEAPNLGFESGNQDQGDFILEKNVLKRLIIPGYRPKMWLKAIKFQIMVEGSIWYEVYSEDETPEKKFNLQRIKTFGKTVIMNSERLSHINDFIYKWWLMIILVNSQRIILINRKRIIYF